jgi:glycosyltransferase involved in cell wall biosynthesis
MPKAILFVTHDAFRGGATILLLTFLRWLKNNTTLPFHVLVCRRGELESEFEKLAPVWYLDECIVGRGRLRRTVNRLRGKYVPEQNVLGLAELAPRIASEANVGLIYFNTVANGRILAALSSLQCPIITHAHELELQIKLVAGAEFEHITRLTNYFVTVSDAVRDNLIRRHHVAAAKIERIYGFIPHVPATFRQPLASRRALLAELGIPEYARIVGACGTIVWHKGCDLFLQLAVAIRARAPALPVHFLWVGAKPPGSQFHYLQHDIDSAGLNGCVHFSDAGSAALEYIAAFDVHALTSREESLSLVMLEAATMGVPTVSFDGHGSREFIEDDAGLLVPYLDVSAMAVSVLELLQRQEQRSRLAKRAFEKVQERHDLEIAAPKLLAVIERAFAMRNQRVA